MHVAFVSTFPPSNCGIGHYSASLVEAMAAVDEQLRFTIVAEDAPGQETHESDQIRVVRCWDRKRRWLEDVYGAIRDAEPDLVHLQHEEALLGQDAQLPTLAARLAADGIPCVITLHSVYSGHFGWLPGRWGPQRYHRALRDAGCQLIVHQRRGCEDSLQRQGIPINQLSVIAHGTPKIPAIDKGEARQTIGVPDDALLAVSLGVIHPKKGTHTVVKAFTEVSRRHPKARLLIAGKARERTPLDTLYNAWLRRLMGPGLRGGWVDERPGFHSREAMDNFLAAADVFVLPYRQKYGSASGILHNALGAGKAVICSDGPKFAEAQEAWAGELPDMFPGANDVPGWSRALSLALGDQALRKRLEELSRALGQSTSWPVVAEQHIGAYEATKARICS